MENIGEALKMATGMIVAILLIALIVYVFDITKDMENTKSIQEAQKQMKEFNQKFNAFDKSIMYGTDVVSVIGLAIANNKVYNVERYNDSLGNYDEDSEYSINIEFKTGKDIVLKEEYFIINEYGQVIKPTEDQDPGKNQAVRRIFYGDTDYNLKLDKETLYSQYGDYRRICEENKEVQIDIFDLPDMEVYKTYYNIENIALNKGNTETYHKEVNGIKYLVKKDTTGFGDFKKQIYECKKVGHNEVGRINYMKFEPKNIK